MKFLQEEIEYKNQDGVVKTQTTSTSMVMKSRTFLDQIKNLFKRKVKEEIKSKVGQTFAFRILLQSNKLNLLIRKKNEIN